MSQISKNSGLILCEWPVQTSFFEIRVTFHKASTSSDRFFNDVWAKGWPQEWPQNKINMQWHPIHQWCPKLAKIQDSFCVNNLCNCLFFKIMDTFHKTSTSSDSFNDVSAKVWPQKLTYTNKINMQWHLLHQLCPKLAKIQDSFCVNDLCNCLFFLFGSHFTKQPLPVTLSMMFEAEVDHRNNLTQK